MVDRELVITHLQIIHAWADFARDTDVQFFTEKHLKDIAQWSDDAISLLKENETTNTGKERIFECKKCGYGIVDIFINDESKYDLIPKCCPNCGRKVK